MLTLEERIAVVGARLRGLSYEAVQAEFVRKFGKPGPTRANIRLLVNKFQRTGSVADGNRSGRPTSENTVQSVQQAIERSLTASIRRLSRELDATRSTVWKVLHFTLKKTCLSYQSATQT